MQAPSLYAVNNRTFTGLHSRIYRLRSHVVAQTAWPHSPEPTSTWPWLAPRPLRSGPNTTSFPIDDRQLFHENVFHIMLSGAGGIFLFNPWWRVGILPRLTVEDNRAFSAALTDLDRVAGCHDRSWVVDYGRRYYDDVLLSGMDVGGRRLWRLTLNHSVGQRPDVTGIPIVLGQPLPNSQPSWQDRLPQATRRKGCRS